jgi:hypothetical protein
MTFIVPCQYFFKCFIKSGGGKIKKFFNRLELFSWWAACIRPNFVLIGVSLLFFSSSIRDIASFADRRMLRLTVVLFFTSVVVAIMVVTFSVIRSAVKEVKLNGKGGMVTFFFTADTATI